MIRRIEGLVTVNAGKEVYVQEGYDSAKLFINGVEVRLTIEEMRHLSMCLTGAAARCELREQNLQNETPKES